MIVSQRDKKFFVRKSVLNSPREDGSNSERTTNLSFSVRGDILEQKFKKNVWQSWPPSILAGLMLGDSHTLQVLCDERDHALTLVAIVSSFEI